MTEENKTEFTVTEADFPLPFCACCGQLFIAGKWRMPPLCFTLDQSKVVDKGVCPACALIVVAEVADNEHEHIEHHAELLRN